MQDRELGFTISYGGARLSEVAAQKFGTRWSAQRVSCIVGLPEIPGFGKLREIGRGGNSRVYEAREFEFDRLVAVKVLNERIRSGTAAAAFERECRTMGRLVHHPNIVTILKSAFTADDHPCIVMELFRAGSYFEVLRATGSIDQREVLRLGVKIAGALMTAHGSGVLHGDVKPHNILRSRFGDPALGDFGIATLLNGRAGQLPRGLSAHYTAPDLVDGPPTPASDQYSLAATLYTLALGSRPYELVDPSPQQSRVQVLMRTLNEPVPRLPDRFPRALADSLWRAMSKDPDSRFENLSDFASMLNAAEDEIGATPTDLPIADDPVRLASQAARIVFSDGRAEQLDEDLIVGRNPGFKPLTARQRGVVRGSGDRTVSRRHLELKATDGLAAVAVLGRGAVLERSDGTVQMLPTHRESILEDGDKLHFGANCWLRYDQVHQSRLA